jgi:nicotinate-nucleotide adenylyltransferase
LRVGIFGGTFNPIHYGHLRTAEEVRLRLGYDKILFIPSGTPPLKTKGIASASHRFEMARIAILDNPFFEISDIETRRRGKSYTVSTIEELQEAYPGRQFYLILGIDAFLDLPNWRDPDRLIALSNFVIISRPGFSFGDLSLSPYLKKTVRRSLREIDGAKKDSYPLILKSGKDCILLRTTPLGISATDIRGYIKQGKSVKYLLPAEVQSFIIRNKLFKN